MPLSAAGHAQKDAAANGLVREEFAAIYSSDVSRARTDRRSVVIMVTVKYLC